MTKKGQFFALANWFPRCSQGVSFIPKAGLQKAFEDFWEKLMKEKQNLIIAKIIYLKVYLTSLKLLLWEFQVMQLLKIAMSPVLSDIKIEWSLPEEYEVIQTPQEHAACFMGGTITTFGLIFPRFSFDHMGPEFTNLCHQSQYPFPNRFPERGTANFFSVGTMDSDHSMSFEGAGGSRQASMDKMPSPEEQSRNHQHSRQLQFRHTKFNSVTGPQQVHQPSSLMKQALSSSHQSQTQSQTLDGQGQNQGQVPNYSYTYRRVGRGRNRGCFSGATVASSREGSRDSRDDDSGYGNEMVSHKS